MSAYLVLCHHGPLPMWLRVVLIAVATGAFAALAWTAWEMWRWRS